MFYSRKREMATEEIKELKEDHVKIKGQRHISELSDLKLLYTFEPHVRREHIQEALRWSKFSAGKGF